MEYLKNLLAFIYGEVENLTLMCALLGRIIE